jgi:hypothetical protein
VKINMKTSKTNLSRLNFIVAIAALIFIILSCSSPKSVTPVTEERVEPKLIVSVPEIMNHSVSDLKKLLGKETMKYPIKSYYDDRVIGEAYQYRKERIVITVEFVKNKAKFIWFELHLAGIINTPQDALARFGLTGMTLIGEKNYRRTFSGKPYPVVLIEDPKEGEFYSLEVGNSPDRGAVDRVNSNS